MQGPRCSLCHQAVVVEQRYAGTRLCREHFLQSFARRAKAAIADQGRLPEGRIAVALSGGKDSVSLLHFLHAMVRDHPRIGLVAITVDEGIAGYRDSALAICRRLAAELDVEWHVVTTRELAGYSIDEYASGAAGPAVPRRTPASAPLPHPEGLEHEAPGPSPRPACGPCGVFRRAGINRLARRLGCVAVATGHNLDDSAQTILMNHLKGDVERLARLAPHDEPAGPGMVRRIIPFRSIPEKEVLLYAVLHGLPLHMEEECPYAARSHRFEVRDLLVQLEERTPGTRHALVRGHDKLRPLLASLPKTAVVACQSCGEPCSDGTCMACRMRAPTAPAA